MDHVIGGIGRRNLYKGVAHSQEEKVIDVEYPKFCHT
jgi:hypothetical protein